MKDYKGMPPRSMPAFSLRRRPSSIRDVPLRYAAHMAEELGMPDAVSGFLEATLKEEKATDAALTFWRKSVVNVEAEHAL